jgi:aspartate/methionine/tyrosine aminotransferase
MLSNLSRELLAALNPLYAARNEALAQGEKIVDLVSGNVNQHGMIFPQEPLKQAMQAALDQARIYQPDSLGQRVARQAIADYYKRSGLFLPADQILITPGTSVSYFYCFKLVAEPGDEILCPSPSYPLFETIGRLCDVELRFYRLLESLRWAIDLNYLESQLTTKTRAVVLISPHNPTGMVASQEQLEGVAEIARRHHLAIIADEVFSEFLFDRDRLPRPASTAAPLIFTLNGFSKMFALPGLKLGWVAVSGDPEWVQKSLSTLELISDTFLPVNEMVQFAVPAIFQSGASFLPIYTAWVQSCRNTAVEMLCQCPTLQLVPPSGGFYLAARVLRTDRDEEALVLDLLRESKVLVHPGYYYDIPPSHLVMTFIQEPQTLRDSLARLCNQLEEY